MVAASPYTVVDSLLKEKTYTSSKDYFYCFFVLFFCSSFLVDFERIMKWNNKLKGGDRNLPPVINFLL